MQCFHLRTHPQIGADGANSLVRRQMRTDNYTESYDQMGLIATVQLRQPDADNHTAWQRFLPDGVLAVLPLSGELSSIVWSTRSAKVKELLSLGEIEFVDALNEQLVSIGRSSVDTGENNMNNIQGNSIIGSRLFPIQFRVYPKNEFISGAMRTVDQLFGKAGSVSANELQAPPEMAALYGQSRAAFPLGFAHSATYVAHGTALIG